jgi:neutral amino acid transport system permease protein
MLLAFYLNLAMNGIVQGLIIALAALSLSLCFAVARFPNAATGDFITVGAYVGVGAQRLGGGSIVLGGVAAIVATAGIGIAAYILIFRRLANRSMVAALIASIGLAFLLRSMLTFFVGFDQQVLRVPIARAMNVAGVRILPVDLWLALVAMIALSVVFALLFLTPLGRRMRAVADNPDLAKASGISADSVMVTLWALIGAVSAVTGIMLGIKTVVTPEMGWDVLLPAFAAAILGGVGNPVGAVVAGVALGMIQELSTPMVGFTYKIAFAFLVLIVVLLVRPEGLLGQPEKVR